MTVESNRGAALRKIYEERVEPATGDEPAHFFDNLAEVVMLFCPGECVCDAQLASGWLESVADEQDHEERTMALAEAKAAVWEAVCELGGRTPEEVLEEELDFAVTYDAVLRDLGAPPDDAVFPTPE